MGDYATEHFLLHLSPIVFFLLVQGQRSFIPKTERADFKLGRQENNIPQSGQWDENVWKACVYIYPTSKGSVRAPQGATGPRLPAPATLASDAQICFFTSRETRRRILWDLIYCLNGRKSSARPGSDLLFRCFVLLLTLTNHNVDAATVVFRL